jgi:hypothetical protein
MRKLTTIQKREKLNDVFAVDEPGAGGANHLYVISEHNNGEHEMGTIIMQNGPRNMPGSVPGVIDSDLLEIVRDRLVCFQNGPFRCRENEMTLLAVEEALMWLNRRVEDRIERAVLGTNIK